MQFPESCFMDVLHCITERKLMAHAIKLSLYKVALTVQTNETSQCVPYWEGTARFGFQRCCLALMRKVNPIMLMQMEFCHLTHCPLLHWGRPAEDKNRLAAMFKLDSYLSWDWGQWCSTVADKQALLKLETTPRHARWRQTHLCNYKNDVSGAFASSCQNSEGYSLTDRRFICPCTAFFSTPGFYHSPSLNLQGVQNLADLVPRLFFSPFQHISVRQSFTVNSQLNY